MKRRRPKKNMNYKLLCSHFGAHTVKMVRHICMPHTPLIGQSMYLCVSSVFKSDCCVRCVGMFVQCLMSFFVVCCFFALLEYFLQLSQHIFKRLHSVRAAKTVTSIRLSVLMCCFSLNSTEFPKRIA